MAKKIKNNEELVVDMMNFSPYGGLSQIFIMEAIRRYTEEVIEAEEELLEQERRDEEEGKVSIVSTEGWIGVAKDLKKRMDDFYDKNY